LELHDEEEIERESRSAAFLWNTSRKVKQSAASVIEMLNQAGKVGARPKRGNRNMILSKKYLFLSLI